MILNRKSAIQSKSGVRITHGILLCLLTVSVLSLCSIASFADDTDIYKPKVRHNVMILMDSSGSMDWPLYEHSISYADFYDYICVNRTKWTDSYDITNNGYGTNAKYFGSSNKKTRTKIYLIYGSTGYANGLTGDAGNPGGPDNPSISWAADSAADMHTYLNSDGELEDDNGKKPGESGYIGRISTVVDGTTGKTMITIDGDRLPNGKDVVLHDWQQNYDGSTIDKGFLGMLNAPGNYFSGYFYDGSSTSNNWKPVTDASSCYTSNPSQAATASGKEQCYFFATGNWVNMQMIFNLRVIAGGTQVAWSFCDYPPGVTYNTVSYTAVSKNYYPPPPASAPGSAPKGYDSNTEMPASYVIYNSFSNRMRIYFSNIKLWYQSTNKCDKIELYDENGILKYTYKQKSAPFWSDWIAGKKIQLRFITYNQTGTRYWKVDRYQYESIGTGGLYRFDKRIEVAKAAIIDVIELTRGKINWGLMSFDHTGGADGATLRQPINPSFNDDQQKQSIINQLNNIGADGGTPLGEALQDVFKYFYGKDNIHRDCNKNFVITLTDGFPSADTYWARITGLDFSNPSWHDDVQFTEDPIQYSSPPNDYYDDVAAYMYTHSWLNMTDVPQNPGDYTADELKKKRDSSPDNITVHNIGFNSDSPMLQHASDIGGGIYMTAYSKSQLMHAFRSIGLLIGEYTSYTAPVVSIDEANRVQSGDKLYMALFKPNEDVYWSGNLKKYGLKYGKPIGCNTKDKWYVVDKGSGSGPVDGKEATDCNGNMIAETSSYWSTTNDGGDVEKGGAGKVLYNSIPEPGNYLLTSTNTNFRNIYTELGSGLVRVGSDTLTNTDLGVAANIDRYKIINFLYGYTYDAHDGTNGTTLGAPKEKSSWPMGPVIHSTPKIIDYFDSSGNLTNRFIAVGANDGMLHVFNDTNGSEIFSFIPPAVLIRLQQFDPALENRKVYTVDSSPILVNLADTNKTRLLVFGLRRGGRAYYALDITNPNPNAWTFKWEISSNTPGMEELGYTMPIPQHLRIVTTESDGETKIIKDILLIPGGYDNLEDDRGKDNSDYTLTSSYTNAMGRAVYIVDASTGDLISDAYFDIGNQFVYNASASDITGKMKYCFAADPTIISNYKGIVLAIYITDLYGQVFKLTYDGTIKLNLIYKMNPMSDQKSDYAYLSNFKTWSSGEADPRQPAFSLIGFPLKNPRKTFYSPDVSYAGNCFTDVPVLYMGTGDREHPTHVGSSGNKVKNGLYGFYDAHAYFKLNYPALTYSDNTDYFTENNLLNVTCGAMEPDLELYHDAADNWQTKANIKTFLQENNKGWYLLFSELDNCAAVDNNVDFVNQNEHDGEKCISPVTLFAKVLYAPTFQPVASTADPCIYDNVARIFAVDYCTGNAVYNFYKGNDTINSDGEITEKKYTRLDRYLAIGDHIPSGVTIVIRYGKAAGFISVGGKIYPLPDIDMPGSMIPFYWKEIHN